jgi:hypothetical protein
MRALVALSLLAAILLCGAPISAADPAAAKQAAPEKKQKTNFLTADNGLGAAALGEVGLTLGAMALSGPTQWQGYQRGDNGIPFINDTAGTQFGDCTAAEGGEIAKALMAQNDKPSEPPAPEGVLRLSGAETKFAAKAFDSKAIYQAGQSMNCAN